MSIGIEVIAEKCLGCGLCVSSCPQDAITLGDGGTAVIGESCNLCGSCIKGCPAEAIVKQGASLETLDYLDTSHLKDCRDVWVIAEISDEKVAECTFELLGEARRLVVGTDHRVAAVLLCADPSGYPQELIRYGADIVYLIQSPLFRHFSDEPYKQAIVRLVHDEMPLVMLLSATAMGRSLAPRIAAALGTGLTADCTELELKPNGLLVQTRPTFGGNLYARLLCPGTSPQMATVRSKVMKPITPNSTRQGTVVEVHFIPDQERILAELVEFIHAQGEKSIEEAEIVVSAGFGCAKPEGLALVEELADVLGGAMGASRKVVDAGLISYERQIGQTGKTVGPKIYIAVGISGAIQHLVGMSSSNTIIAINLDPDAPIFHAADIGIVADAYVFLPKLIEKLKSVKKAECP